MDFSGVVDTILTYAAQGSGGAFEDFVKVLVNQAYQRVLVDGRVPHESREFTFSTVADQSQYGLPLYVKEVLNIEDPTTPQFIYGITARQYDRSYPGTTESGTPTMAYPLGVRGAQALPGTTGTVTIVSTSAVDTGSNYQVRLTGFDGDDNLVTELVTLTGTTAVSSENSYSSTLGLERIVKSPVSGYTISGNLTVADSDGDTLAVLPVWWTSPEYQWIEFHPIPAEAITYTVRAEMRKPPLVNDSDWPEFPDAFHLLLVYGVTMDLLPTLGKAETAGAHRASYDRLMGELRKSVSRRSMNVWRLADVQSGHGPRQRPQRPLIQGVDFGLVS